MLEPRSANAPTYAQLCVIAKEQIEADLTIDDAEWKARIKDRLVTLRFDCPRNTEVINRAMSAVQRSLEKRLGPRPVPRPVPIRQATPPAIHPSPPLTMTELTETLEKAGPNCKPPSPGCEQKRDSPSRKSGWCTFADLFAVQQPAPDRGTLQEQIDAYRMAQPKPEFRATAKGWVPITPSRK